MVQNTLINVEQRVYEEQLKRKQEEQKAEEDQRMLEAFKEQYKIPIKQSVELSKFEGV